jgi:mannose/fructose/N-acetylgalactosamine-specific phosphotransferase system component IIB
VPVVLVRIDDRLIHGQVVEGWLPVFRVQRIVVASDPAAADPTYRALMALSVPEEVALEVLPVAQAAKALEGPGVAADRTLVLVAGPQEALALLDAGARFDSLNVGGLHYAAGTLQIGKAIFLSDEDMRALDAIAARGVRLEGRAVPGDTPVDVLSLMRTKA